MPTPDPKEPMDTYLCVLLELNLIQAETVYTQTQICNIIAGNQQDFDSIYDDTSARQAARDEFMSTASIIVVIDKDEDCQ